MNENEVKEVKEIKEEEKTCFCKSKFVKKTLVIAIGSFIGVYCALSLFALTHKPPVHQFMGPMGPAPSHFVTPFGPGDYRSWGPTGQCDCAFKKRPPKCDHHFRGEGKMPPMPDKALKKEPNKAPQK